jgi:hypothetical protein
MKREHPGPWRWSEFGDLEDAMGEFVAYVAEEGQGKADPSFSIAVESSHASELIRAAPEMEALLLEYAGTVGYVCQDECDHLHCRNRRLLSRIDRARGGG